MKGTLMSSLDQCLNCIEVISILNKRGLSIRADLPAKNTLFMLHEIWMTQTRNPIESSIKLDMS